MRRNRSTWPEFWTPTIHTDGWLQLFCARCRGCQVWPPLNAWKAALVSTDACDKEAWKPHARGRKWQPRFGPMWTKNGWRKEKVSSWTSREKEYIKFAVFMWADHFWIMSHSKEYLERMLRDLIEEASRWDLVPKPASQWWTSTYDAEEKSDIVFFGASKGCYKFPFDDTFKMLGCARNRQRKTCDAVEERMRSANKAFWKDIVIYIQK